MRLSSRAISVLAVLAVIAGGCIAGCSTPNAGISSLSETPSPPASVAASPRPSPPAPPAPASGIVVSSSSLALIDDDGAILDEIPFNDTFATARAKLTAWFAEPPATSMLEGSHCGPGGIVDRWGDSVTVTEAAGGWIDLGINFIVTVDEQEFGGLSIGSRGGSTVGSSASALSAQLPSEWTVTEPNLTRVYFDRTNDTYAAYAYALDGDEIDQIIAPYALLEGC